MGVCKSGGHFEEEVDAEEKEDQVGRPGSEHGRELADAAHGFEESGDGPVANADGYAECDAAEGAAAADENGEGNREQHADGSDERVSNFFVPLNGEGRDVEPGALQAENVAAKVAPAHLERLNHFTIEIGGRLDEFGQRSYREGRVFFNGAAGEVADPAGFECPGFFGVEPLGAIGKDAALHLEGDGIEFDDAEAAEKFLRGLEDVVIVDLGIFAENPALRAGVGLRGLSLDLVTKRVLALVGVGEIGVVENEKRGGKDQAGEKQREGEAVEADAAGLEGDDFVVFAENAEGDEGGDESGERRKLVDEIRNQETEIVDDDQEGDAVASDVVEEFEKGEGFKEQDESAEDQEEIVGEAAEHIDVNDGRKVGGSERKGLVKGFAIFLANGLASLAAGAALANQSAPGHETRDEGKRRRLAPIAFHTRQKREAGEDEYDVGGPHANGRQNDALARQSGAHDEQQIVAGDDEDGEKRAGGASPAARLRAEGHGDQCESKAGEGKGEALVEFNAGIAPAGAAIVPQIAERTFGIAEGADLS